MHTFVVETCCEEGLDGRDFSVQLQGVEYVVVDGVFYFFYWGEGMSCLKIFLLALFDWLETMVIMESLEELLR